VLEYINAKLLGLYRAFYIGKRLYSLRGINGNKYLESAREFNKLAMRWIG
jgi:hypothetical protein